jgi:hypothetical protein
MGSYFNIILRDEKVVVCIILVLTLLSSNVFFLLLTKFAVAKNIKQIKTVRDNLKLNCLVVHFFIFLAAEKIMSEGATDN